MIFKLCKRLSILGEAQIRKAIGTQSIESLGQLTEEGKRKLIFRTELITWEKIPYSLYTLLTDPKGKEKAIHDIIVKKLKYCQNLENWEFLSDLVNAILKDAPEQRTHALNKVFDKYINVINLSGELQNALRTMRKTTLTIEDFKPAITEVVVLINQNMLLNKVLIADIPTLASRNAHRPKHAKAKSFVALHPVHPKPTKLSFARNPEALKWMTTTNLKTAIQIKISPNGLMDPVEPKNPKEMHARSVSAKN